MNISLYEVMSIICIAGMILGIHWMNSPKTAIRGNLLGAISLLTAVMLTLAVNGIFSHGVLWAGLIIGSIIGYYMAVKVTMLKMPQMIAVLNGFGGGASALVSIIIIASSEGNSDLFSLSTAFLALFVGSITFSGSMIAAAKLDQKLPQRPMVLKGHFIITMAVLLMIIIASVFGIMMNTANNVFIILITLLLSFILGIVFTIRVGGADMPITISLLNSLSGVAGAIAGFAIYDALLIAVGGIVGAAGLILTQVMCRGMNRSLVQVLAGKTSIQNKLSNELCCKDIRNEEEINEKNVQHEYKNNNEKFEEDENDDIKISRIINGANKVIIVPGYGMALSQAQYEVKNMYDSLVAMGKEVKFAIHPVAGRMPGHMNVLLAEVDIPYDKLYELEAINGEFSSTDLVIVIGANDVINPAANTAKDTPIYGMPILSVDQAKHIIIFNRDTKPGYSGVPNSLYNIPEVILKLGDAKETVRELLQQLNSLKV
ncbi:MAG TPA: NAD(P)(+) transhydrogenase (Re/Si-specific) subunit beta [Clostridiaceae bacterium]|nr:NAD(P)(+) transhydrogenase (Re/Si-specific) subunit beta [Clostridiaceae bacterium]